MTEQEKIALVTGASGGIGQTTALALAEPGWSVYAAARKPEAIATRAVARLRPVALDVTDDASMRTAVDRALESGRIDLLVNPAGYGL